MQEEKLVDIRPEWAWCETCNCAAMICPKCGNNACNGTYGEVDGKECDVCPQVYQLQEEAYGSGTQPTKEECSSIIKDALDELLKKNE